MKLQKKENKKCSCEYCSKGNLEKAIKAVKEDNLSLGKAENTTDMKKATI